MDKEISEQITKGLMNGFAIAASLAVIILMLIAYVGAGHGF